MHRAPTRHFPLHFSGFRRQLQHCFLTDAPPKQNRAPFIRMRSKPFPIALRVFIVTFLMREPCPALRCFRAADEFCCRSAHSGLNAASFRHSEQRRTNSIAPAPKTKALSGERRPLNESFPMLFSGLNARSRNSTLQYATKRNLRNFGISANC